MKVTKVGRDPRKFYVGKSAECTNCTTVVTFEESDGPVKDSDDIRESGYYLEWHCPTCGRYNTLWGGVSASSSYWDR